MHRHDSTYAPARRGRRLATLAHTDPRLIFAAGRLVRVAARWVSPWRVGGGR